MTMQIRTISLYGKNGERRDVDFELGAVNIITGASKRGKTSLIDIVEYCLGASECTVKEGYIRQTVDWYSILLQFTDSQLFIARAAPLPGAKANSAAHMLIANDITIPMRSEITNSTNIDSVVSFLTSKVGVPEQITEVPEGQTRSKVNISFRHSRYYLFQSQNEIANNEVLFHQQAKPHIPQNIKDTLPYFIGAADDGRLADIETLRSLKRERNQLARQLNEIESLKGNGLQKGYTLLAEAAELGLYKSNNLIPSDIVLVEELIKISKWKPEDIDSEQSTDPLVNLEREYQELLQKKNTLKFRLREAREYDASESGFEKAVNDQSYRLNAIGLFKKFERTHGNCPICETHNVGESKFEIIIKRALSDLDSKLDGISRSRPRITGYLAQLMEEQDQTLKHIRKIKASINKIREEDDGLTRQVDLDILSARLAGKASLYIESIHWNQDVSGLNNQIDILDEKIFIMSESLDPEALKERLNSQLSCIAEDMTRWARELKLEHSENRIRLDASKLTVVADTPYGVIPLSNMGSGENWIGYHLVTYFALAKWFIEQSRPVGRFLFLDQPTQVYFPSEKSESGDLSEIEKDEDREAVRNMFCWIFETVQSLSPGLQVIITDHADIDEEWFQAAVRDEKWRGDFALIPKNWYESGLD
ncbi:DUF3732 domain-containing protein [Shewanella baltica]|uniref:DUF3732 domain-containing protein n=1 Tax=Shewanella baltica TaxID=62322 RepID=UPI00217EDDA6|nr:DUF3732 domain-containing protein [Shewanella baltica]MCS6211095.1 DUF3732 domain-containing protein [Shewanella baltica]